MLPDRYFDHAATTPLDPRVLAEMMPFLTGEYGNAHSLHTLGARAMQAVELARERVAELIGAEDPAQIYFTSGATESNNWVIQSFKTGAISPFEHSAVLEPALRQGFDRLRNDRTLIRPPDVRVPLISVMVVNNEIGTIWRAADFAPYADAVHSDLTQAAGKVSLDLIGLDLASFSAHKFYGPKGVGALYAADTPPRPLLLGGEQEHGLRGGTLNVPGIVGMGAAATIAAEQMQPDRVRAEALRNIILDELADLADWRVNGGTNVSPYILSLSFRTISGESLVIEADRRGFAISAGAACSSRSTEPSHVLKALGLTDDWLRGTIRISFGRSNTPDAARELARTMLTSVEKLRTMS